MKEIIVNNADYVVQLQEIHPQKMNWNSLVLRYKNNNHCSYHVFRHKVMEGKPLDC